VGYYLGFRVSGWSFSLFRHVLPSSYSTCAAAEKRLNAPPHAAGGLVRRALNHLIQ